MTDSKMPKKRLKAHKNLPKGWRWKKGAYRYRVPKGDEHLWDGKTEFGLGKTLADAYRTWAERVEFLENVVNIKDLIERYLVEVAPFKAQRTYEENRRQASYLNKAFGHMNIHSMRPTFVYQYIDKRSAKIAAKREIKLLSHIYTKAVEWGYLDRHPFKGQVRLSGEKPRERYVTEDEYEALMEGEGIMPLFVEFAVLTGLRKGDILQLKRSALKEDGIHVTTQKTNKRRIISWTDQLDDCVQEIITHRGIDISPWLFCKQDGGCYYVGGKSSGFDSMWKRHREKCGLSDIRIHDLRAKTASDFEDEKDAQALLAHDNLSMTRAYIRKPKTVSPLK